ncbi:hypothetical protein AMK16_20525 [Streptomyces sp. CB00455]|nr:hypothetical protein AMK16_20525 [Streptomyces sp. CB00455]
MATGAPDAVRGVHAEPDRLQQAGTSGGQPLPEGGRGGEGVLARAGTAQPLALLDVGRARRTQVTGGAPHSVPDAVAEPSGFQQPRPGRFEVDAERGLGT